MAMCGWRLSLLCGRPLKSDADWVHQPHLHRMGEVSSSLFPRNELYHVPGGSKSIGDLWE
jgi:hypothetical protein